MYIDLEIIAWWLFIFGALYYVGPLIARIIYVPIWVGEQLDRLHNVITLRLSRLFGIARKPQE